ncbi:MAG: glycoside hydrolase family 3 C-terminal domain-containing protein [Bacteroidetes bacterium]|nr:glycoside hydrolase family 3 C-terminal domain-containing protein [Bacteroidota bacterium]
MKSGPAFLMILFFMLFSFLLKAQQPIYKNPTAPVEKRTEDLLSRMTAEEKVDMLGGIDGFYIRPNERLGIPKIKMADGPLGVRNYGKATAFPGGICFAATWNPDLVRKFGEAVGTEARSKGVHIMLAPGVNIYRAPMCGRNFEYYGEDPFLAGRMAVSYVSGVQSKGVVATIKHFAANNQEYDRNRVSSEVDERTLREIYLPAFRAAVEEAHVGAVMNSYNLINGVHASQNVHLLKTILKGDWKFDGIVMSDWGSTYDGVAAAQAGLDLEMPAADFMNRKTLLPGLDDGSLSMDMIDDKVRRMLRIMFRFGFFDRPQTDSTLALYNTDSQNVALQAAREGIVLLKNDNRILPLDKKKIRSIAVIGPDAHPAVPGGGGSSIITPNHTVSFRDGIIEKAGDSVKVYYSPGVNTDLDEMFANSLFFHFNEKGEKIDGLLGEYYSNKNLEGKPFIVKNDEHISFDWGNGSPSPSIPVDSFSIRWTGKIHISQNSSYYFYVGGNNGFRLFLDDQQIMNEWNNPSFLSKDTSVLLQGGHDYSIRLEYYENRGEAQISLGYRIVADPQSTEAVRLAKQTDIAIVCVGFNPSTESEGFDRPFALPKEQVELIKAIAGVNKKTIVVLTAGGNVATADWIGMIPGYIQAWYSGQEGGTALAEILFGEVNPSGKLPVTFEKKWEDNATFHSYFDQDNDKKVAYSEGVFLGYRHFDKNNTEPLFPFGYGLSYTTFAFKNITVSGSIIKAGSPVTVTFEVTNTGSREGAEVAQVYVRDIEASVPRPVKELKEFRKIWLKPGKTVKVSIKLKPEAFSFYDVTTKSWKIEPGLFEILIGSSSRNILLKSAVEIN